MYNTLYIHNILYTLISNNHSIPQLCRFVVRLLCAKVKIHSVDQEVEIPKAKVDTPVAKSLEKFTYPTRWGGDLLSFPSQGSKQPGRTAVSAALFLGRIRWHFPMISTSSIWGIQAWPIDQFWTWEGWEELPEMKPTFWWRYKRVTFYCASKIQRWD